MSLILRHFSRFSSRAVIPIRTSAPFRAPIFAYKRAIHSAARVRHDQPATPPPPGSGHPAETSPALVTAQTNSDQASLGDVRDLLPRDIVKELDNYIVGQENAKKAVAIAYRNRWRRHRVPSEIKEEVIPKNILMIGPTGVGKTEIARRLAKLSNAPFIKVEATKFTEVGFRGKDVDSIITDLVDMAVANLKTRLKAKLRPNVKKAVEEKLLTLLAGSNATSSTRDSLRNMVRTGALDDRVIEVEVTEPRSKPMMGMGMDSIFDMLGNFGVVLGGGKKVNVRKLKVKDARPVLEENEVDKLVSEETVIQEALRSVQEDGIVFIDEIDKIVQRADQRQHTSSASDEGVQKDLLPLIEGTVINTRYGNVDTTRILFIASGAFHSCKPSDLLAELQGRLPIRVELTPLTQHDMYRILTEPQNSLIKQHVALLKTEGVDVDFTDDGIREIAAVATEVNAAQENIVLERIMEDISFNCDTYAGRKLKVDASHVRKHIGDLVKRTDLSRFIL